MNKRYLFCRIAYSPVRLNEQDSSEMVTQMLFGEVAELLAQTEKWLHIRSMEDSYEGFVDPKQFITLSEIEMEHWKLSRKRCFSSVLLNGPRGLISLPAGCFTKEHFTINNHFYQRQQVASNPSNWQQYAQSFLNVSYLWGGRSHYGIDCSGFTQQIMRFRNVELPRDASQQVLQGTDISFDNREIGDIVFFQNAQQKVTHVGILLEKDKIIHASGFVKIDTINKEGIICAETHQLTHVFHSIKRYTV